MSGYSTLQLKALTLERWNQSRRVYAAEHEKRITQDDFMNIVLDSYEKHRSVF